MLLAISIVTFFIVWFFLGFRVIRETSRAVVVRMGNPLRRIESGLKHIWWPFEWLSYFPTTIQELNFRSAGIITTAGKYNQAKYGQALVVVEVAMYFRWPATDEGLIKALRALGTTNLSEIEDLFEESVLDTVRTVGGGKTWGEIAQERKKLAQEVRESLGDEAEDPIKIADLPDIRIAIKHVDLPKDLMGALTKPEIARLEKEAAITKAQGDKQATILNGEGIANARKKLFAAIGKEPEDMQKEVLLRLSEMAQGTANTIFPIPTRILDVFEGAFGSKTKGLDLESLLKTDMGKKFIQDIVNELSKK
jgi:regulator of protease activity HflC (stomatin/prohibitin superfamily)